LLIYYIFLFCSKFIVIDTDLLYYNCNISDFKKRHLASYNAKENKDWLQVNVTEKAEHFLLKSFKT
jgi:hypothetical protein